MKKICIVINHFQVQDGIARAAIGFANELAERGKIEITIRPLFKCDSKMIRKVVPGVKVKPVLGFYFQGLARLVDLIPDRLLYWMIFRKQRFDIEIGYCMKLPIKIVAASSNQNCKHFAWMHGYDAGLTLKPFYEKMDKVICVSREGEERFNKETEGAIPVDYSYNLVNDETVRKMGQETIELQKTEAITFVGVGRHETGKGFLRLIECVGRLKKEGYRLNLWLIGDGPQTAEMKQRVSDLRLEKNVLFLGEQRNPHAYTSKADIFVCASFGEGYSTACTEAIMLGVPVLTTNVGGAQEIIEDAQAGMLVGLKDEDIYQGMKTILDQPSLIQEWKKTLKTTRKAFSHTERAERLRKLLEI